MTSHVKVHGIVPRIQYLADGTLTEYEFPFVIFKTSDIDVYFGDSKQDISTYNVSEARRSDGGTVIFNEAPSNGTLITIVRNLSIERTTDFQEGGALRANVLNDELDYQIACQQQIADSLNRSMVLPPYASDINVDLTLPTPSAGKAIVWNSAGTNLENSAVEVNALESTLKDYKTVAQNAAITATEKAEVASDKADIATSQAQIATQKANETALTLANKAEKDFSNISEENARQLIGNRIWISGEYDLSSTANVVISHNLNLTDVRKAIAIPYLKFTRATAGYSVGDIISNFIITGEYYCPGGSLVASSDFSHTLNLFGNSVVIPKVTNDTGILTYNKSTGLVSLVNIAHIKAFVKIIY